MQITPNHQEQRDLSQQLALMLARALHSDLLVKSAKVAAAHAAKGSAASALLSVTLAVLRGSYFCVMRERKAAVEMACTHANITRVLLAGMAAALLSVMWASLHVSMKVFGVCACVIRACQRAT